MAAQNPNAIMKQVQNLQAKVAELQREIEEREFVNAVGGGAVTVTMDGKKRIKTLAIKPEVVDPDDVEMLQDLIISALNDTLTRIDETLEREMGSLTGGLNLQGLLNGGF
jgi:DNA-binding YbaB/EbfC family protein